MQKIVLMSATNGSGCLEVSAAIHRASFIFRIFFKAIFIKIIQYSPNVIIHRGYAGQVILHEPLIFILN